MCNEWTNANQNDKNITEVALTNHILRSLRETLPNNEHINQVRSEKKITSVVEAKSSNTKLNVSHFYLQY